MKILKLKISLDETEVYREILIKSKMTYHDLHLIIQKVFGWQNYHLYEFVVDGHRIGDTETDEYEELSYDSKSKNIMTDKLKFHYEYDFGDAWCHTIEIVEVLEADSNISYPICVAGKGACPPEDCGGISGYEELLETPEEFEEWLGYKYDPKDFTIDWANGRLNDPDCCRKGYTIDDLARMSGKSTSTIRRMIKKLEDNELKDHLWKYEGKLLLLDPKGVPILFDLY